MLRTAAVGSEPLEGCMADGPKLDAKWFWLIFACPNADAANTVKKKEINIERKFIYASLR